MSLSSQQTYGNGVSYYYWPAVAANGFGDVVTSFARSNSTEFASARWAMRFRSETLLSASQYLKQGEDYYGEPGDTNELTYRWGDYGGACVDPESEGFWIMHKYAAPRSIGAGRERNYGTWIGYVPRAVFVDAAHPGVENGSRPYPYQSHLLGYLAALPGKDELRGMLAGTVQAPMRNMAGTIQAVMGHLRNALEQRMEQLEGDS